jgi:predicted dehydrogenase
MTTTRRKLLAQAAAVAATPFISTRVTRALADAPRRKLGFALCGLGTLATGQIAPALQKTAYCRLTGIITDTPAKAEQWRAQYNIPKKSVYRYEDMHRIADNPDIDVVYILTPNALHLEHATAAARAGKHVFCEKPMEISVERCRQMIAAVKGANRLLGVAYRCQFEPHHLECMRIARARELGPLKLINAYFGNNIAPGGWRLQRALAGGGPLMDLGIYALQATRYLTSEEPIWVSATASQGEPPRFTEVEESVAWQARFPSGVVAQCATSYNSGPAGYVRAATEHGWFGLDPAFNYEGIRGARSDGREIAFPPTDQFAVEMDDFSRCILEKTPTRVSGEEGLRDVAIMMAIYDSARTGQPVTIPAGLLALSAAPV